jgi:hypothetical protein
MFVAADGTVAFSALNPFLSFSFRIEQLQRIANVSLTTLFQFESCRSQAFDVSRTFLPAAESLLCVKTVCFFFCPV